MDAKDQPQEMTEWEREVLNAGGYTPTAETQIRREAEILRDQQAERPQKHEEKGTKGADTSDEGANN